MAIKSDREYRDLARSMDADAEEYRASGYASTYEPYKLFEFDGIEYWEQIDRKAYDKTDMSDVLMLYNHEGRVLARSKNGTVKITVDDIGLKVDADLSTTEAARELHAEIKSGLIDQMSFAFTVADDAILREEHKRTRLITGIKKLYDVSAVSVPANPTTSISARAWIDGEIEQEKAERLAREKREEQIMRIKALIGKDE